MTQYLLSVHHDDDTVADVSDEEMQQVFAKVDTFNNELTASGSWVFAGGLEPPTTATVVDATGHRRRRPPTGRTPRPRSTSAASGWSRPPTSTPPWRSPAGLGRLHGPGRGPAVPVRVSDTPGTTSDVDLASVFRAEHGRVVASLARRFGDLDLAEDATGEALLVAAERWPAEGRAAQPGRLADHGRRQQGAGPAPPREAPAGQVRRGRTHGRTSGRRPTRAHRTRRGRPAPAGLHLLPPGAGAGEPGRPHPAPARRAHRRRDRRGVPGARDDDGAADHPLEAEDQGGRASPTGSRGPRTCRRGSVPCSPCSTWSSTRATSAPPARPCAPTSPPRRSGWPGSCARWCERHRRSGRCPRSTVCWP